MGLLAAIVLLIGGIFSTATSAIGIECYKKNEKTKTEKPHNFNFMIVNLTSAVAMILLSFVLIYISVMTKKV
jgi:dipeptide/tripeptide permease